MIGLGFRVWGLGVWGFRDDLQTKLLDDVITCGGDSALGLYRSGPWVAGLRSSLIEAAGSKMKSAETFRAQGLLGGSWVVIHGGCKDPLRVLWGSI